MKYTTIQQYKAAKEHEYWVNYWETQPRPEISPDEGTGLSGLFWCFIAAAIIVISVSLNT